MGRSISDLLHLALMGCSILNNCISRLWGARMSLITLRAYGAIAFHLLHLALMGRSNSDLLHLALMGCSILIYCISRLWGARFSFIESRAYGALEF